jgi:hypothetical protein
MKNLLTSLLAVATVRRALLRGANILLLKASLIDYD